MTHTGLPVGGYRPQSDEAVHLVNQNKEMEEYILRALDILRDNPGVDQRWLQAGRTQIELGWMAVNRAIFQPGRVRLPKDDEIGLPDFMTTQGQP